MPNPTRSATLARARSGLGVVEYPSGSNRTKFGVWFGWNGVKWCAIWVCWVLIGAGFVFRKNASAWGLGRALDALDGWKHVAPSDIRGGDVVVFEFSHIGICEARIDSSHLSVMEGNHFNKSTRVPRSESSIAYGVRPPYAPEAKRYVITTRKKLLHADNSRGSKTLARIPTGTKLRLLQGGTRLWYRVHFGGRTGFILKLYTRKL